MQIKIKTKWHVAIFAAAVTIIAVVNALVINYLILEQSVWMKIVSASIIVTALTSIPIAFWVGLRIKEIYQLNLQQKFLLEHDYLTATYSRDFFFNTLRPQQHKLKGYIVMIDIDHFKQVNDNYGHLVGDKVLKKIGHILFSGCHYDDIVSRFGGEEFVIFLLNANDAVAKLVVERLRLLVEHAESIISGDKIKVTISLGVAKKEQGDSLDSIIDKADQALYMAKGAGRNRAVFFAK